jgi:DNA-binding winged helix-turn-helix (wHTH) protein/tetratricopeptide (TPR) repeat protein
MTEPNVVYEFAHRRVDMARREVLHMGRTIPMYPRCFDALLLLIEHRGTLLGKDFLMQALWPDVVVDENSLAKVISEVRRALGEGPRDAGCIVTIPRRGYRFVADVEVHRNAGTAPVTSGGSQQQPEIHALAVLPFSFLNPSAEDETLSIGLADALITRLGQLRRTVLRPTSSITRFADQRMAPADAGRALAVDAVIAGSVRRAGTTIRVSVQLVSVASDAVLWAEKFDAQSGTTLELEDSISDRVATALTLTLARGERPPVAQRQAADPDAYEHYIRGRYLISKRTRDALVEAVARMERAIAIDPQFALAHAGLSEAWVQLGLRAAVSQSLRPREVMPKARVAAEKALALDDSLSEAHATLGQVLFTYEWKRDDGIAEFLRAIELNPNNQNAQHWYAMALGGLGRFDEALAQIQRALAVDPLAVIVNANVGFLLYRAGRLEEAVAKLQHTVAMEPGFVMTRYRLGLALEALGRYQEAIAEFEAMRPSDTDPLGLTAIARTLALMQHRDDARRELHHVIEIARNTYVPSVLIAGIYFALDEVDRAMEYLERGVEERAISLLWLPFDRYWNRLHGNPRFSRVLASIGLKG